MQGFQAADCLASSLIFSMRCRKPRRMWSRNWVPAAATTRGTTCALAVSPRQSKTQTEQEGYPHERSVGTKQWYHLHIITLVRDGSAQESLVTSTAALPPSPTLPPQATRGGRPGSRRPTHP